MKTKKHARVRHPERFDLVLYLIREEFKSRKFFSGLQKLGLDYCFYQPHLDKPILAAVGFDEPSDEVYNFYFKLIEKRSRKIREDEESITTQARKVWKTLVDLSERENLVGEGLRLKETRESHVAA
jgi:hypothetical protein